MKRELKWGIFLQANYLILKRFLDIPNFILGILLGLGLCLIIIGILPERIYLKIKQLKGAINK